MTLFTHRAVSAHVRYQGRDQYTRRHTPTLVAREVIQPMEMPVHPTRQRDGFSKEIVATMALVFVMSMLFFAAVL